MSTAWALKIVGVIVAAAVCGCKQPRAGDDCKVEGRQRCVDPASALVCVGGSWKRVACGGPTGCSTSGGEVDCSRDGVRAGEYCDSAAEDYACGQDKKTALKCVEKRWVAVASCLGSGGCVSTSKELNCDDSTSESGAPCQSEGDLACTADHAGTLQCKGGLMVAHQACGGALGCRARVSKLACDDSLAALGDRCHVEGSVSCSNDRLAMLTCRSEKMTFARSCARRCLVTGADIECP